MEVDEAMIREWLDQPGADAELSAVGPGTRRKIETGLRARLRALGPLAQNVFSGFVGRI